jgi:hypothetical protein
MGPNRFYISASKTCFGRCGSIRDVELSSRMHGMMNTNVCTVNDREG